MRHKCLRRGQRRCRDVPNDCVRDRFSVATEGALQRGVLGKYMAKKKKSNFRLRRFKINFNADTRGGGASILRGYKEKRHLKRIRGGDFQD